MSDYPAVIPMIAYADGPTALDWLVRVFGFRERERRVSKEGRLEHGEVDTGHGVIMLATPSPYYQGPKRHREGCEAARKWSEVPYIIDGVLVFVDDLEAHFERARDGGATILSELETSPDGRRYRAEDLEGHRWMFMQSGSPNLVAPARQHGT
jgi:PhnB protein